MIVCFQRIFDRASVF